MTQRDAKASNYSVSLLLISKSAQPDCALQGNSRIFAAIRNAVVCVYPSNIHLISNSVSCSIYVSLTSLRWKQISGKEKSISHELPKILEETRLFFLGNKKQLKSHIRRNLRCSLLEARCVVRSSQSKRITIHEKLPWGKEGGVLMFT